MINCPGLARPHLTPLASSAVPATHTLPENQTTSTTRPYKCSTVHQQPHQHLHRGSRHHHQVCVTPLKPSVKEVFGTSIICLTLMLVCLVGQGYANPVATVESGERQRPSILPPPSPRGGELNRHNREAHNANLSSDVQKCKYNLTRIINSSTLAYKLVLHPQQQSKDHRTSADHGREDRLDVASLGDGLVGPAASEVDLDFSPGCRQCEYLLPAPGPRLLILLNFTGGFGVNVPKTENSTANTNVSASQNDLLNSNTDVISQEGEGRNTSGLVTSPNQGDNSTAVAETASHVKGEGEEVEGSADMLVGSSTLLTRLHHSEGESQSFSNLHHNHTASNTSSPYGHVSTVNDSNNITISSANNIALNRDSSKHLQHFIENGTDTLSAALHSSEHNIDTGYESRIAVSKTNSEPSDKVNPEIRHNQKRLPSKWHKSSSTSTTFNHSPRFFGPVVISGPSGFNEDFYGESGQVVEHTNSVKSEKRPVTRRPPSLSSSPQSLPSTASPSSTYPESFHSHSPSTSSAQPSSDVDYQSRFKSNTTTSNRSSSKRLQPGESDLTRDEIVLASSLSSKSEVSSSPSLTSTTTTTVSFKSLSPDNDNQDTHEPNTALIQKHSGLHHNKDCILKIIIEEKLPESQQQTQLESYKTEKTSQPAQEPQVLCWQADGNQQVGEALVYRYTSSVKVTYVWAEKLPSSLSLQFSFLYLNEIECHFQCQTSRHLCLVPTQLCDGHSDCPDGSDESGQVCQVYRPELHAQVETAENNDLYGTLVLGILASCFLLVVGVVSLYLMLKHSKARHSQSRGSGDALLSPPTSHASEASPSTQDAGGQDEALLPERPPLYSSLQPQQHPSGQVVHHQHILTYTGSGVVSSLQPPQYHQIQQHLEGAPSNNNKNDSETVGGSSRGGGCYQQKQLMPHHQQSARASSSSSSFSSPSLQHHRRQHPAACGADSNFPNNNNNSPRVQHHPQMFVPPSVVVPVGGGASANTTASHAVVGYQHAFYNYLPSPAQSSSNGRTGVARVVGVGGELLDDEHVNNHPPHYEQRRHNQQQQHCYSNSSSPPPSSSMSCRFSSLSSSSSTSAMAHATTTLARTSSVVPPIVPPIVSSSCPPHIAVSLDGEEGYSASQRALHSKRQMEHSLLAEYSLIRAPPNRSALERDSPPPPYSQYPPPRVPAGFSLDSLLGEGSQHSHLPPPFLDSVGGTGGGNPSHRRISVTGSRVGESNPSQRSCRASAPNNSH